MSMNEMMEMNRRAFALCDAYNAKIAELSAEIQRIDRDPTVDEFESTEHAVLCAMYGGLIAARDKELEEHDAAMRDMAPQWDGD